MAAAHLGAAGRRAAGAEPAAAGAEPKAQAAAAVGDNPGLSVHRTAGSKCSALHRTAGSKCCGEVHKQLRVRVAQ